MTETTIAELAKTLGGTVYGNTEQVVHSVSALNEYEEGTVAFATETSLKQLNEHIETKGISALVIQKEIEVSTLPEGCSYIQVENPRDALPVLIDQFFPPIVYSPGIHETAVIHSSASIGDDVHIGPYCVVGAQSVIGNNVVLHAHVTIYDAVKIGERCLIHSGVHVRERCLIGAGSVIQNGAVIGADGFGYAPDEKGNLHAIPQVGIVTLAERVDVGANSCIDRAALGTTSVAAQAKLDNLVQVGHNSKIGSRVIMCGNSAVGGSVEVGDGVVLGGKAALADHVSVCSGTRLAGKTGVISDISSPGDYAGYPHRTARDWRKEQVFLRKLMGWQKPLRKLLSQNKGD